MTPRIYIYEPNFFPRIFFFLEKYKGFSTICSRLIFSTDYNFNFIYHSFYNILCLNLIIQVLQYHVGSENAWIQSYLPARRAPIINLHLSSWKPSYSEAYCWVCEQPIALRPACCWPHLNYLILQATSFHMQLYTTRTKLFVISKEP